MRWAAVALGLCASAAAAQDGSETRAFLDALVDDPPEVSHAFFSDWLAGGVPLADWEALRAQHGADFGPLTELTIHQERTLDDGDLLVAFHGTFGAALGDKVCGIVIWDDPANGVGIRLVRLNFLPVDRVSLVPDADRTRLAAQAGCPEGLLDAN